MRYRFVIDTATLAEGAAAQRFFPVVVLSAAWRVLGGVALLAAPPLGSASDAIFQRRPP